MILTNLFHSLPEALPEVLEMNMKNGLHGLSFIWR